MSLFAAIVRTVVNVATLPLAVVKDALTLGGVVVDEPKSYTEQKLDQIKREAEVRKPT